MTEDPALELRFALAEGDAGPLAASLRERVLAGGAQRRRPGDSLEAGEPIPGVGVFLRAADRLRRFLSDLSQRDWHQPTIRELDAQELVGHLIGVEEDFATTLEGFDGPASADHIGSTQGRALGQRGRTPADTLGDWVKAVNGTAALIEAIADPGRQVSFHRLTLDLDSFLVVRAFELWTHEEDIRRALTKPAADPEPDVLSSMTALAVPLLPAGVAALGAKTDKTARLVLVGAGGGAWDVPLAGSPRRATPGCGHHVHITVDAAAFCRVVANRASLESSDVEVHGDQDVARAVFAAAAALALD